MLSRIARHVLAILVSIVASEEGIHCECTKLKKVSILNNSAITYVCTHVFVAHTIPGWIVDSGATKHIAKDRVRCVDYKRIPTGTQYVIFW